MADRIVIERDCPQDCPERHLYTHDYTHRRVLDPGSFECVDNADERWLYLVTEEVHQALAGGEQP